MPKAEPLGATVVVTRPAHQADGLCQLVEQHGGTALRFPVLDITGPDDEASVVAMIQRLAEFDMAIFISPNAVQWGMRLAGALPPALKIAAVGKGSARELMQRGIEPDIFPSQQFNSEALLAMDAMRDVTDQRIVIFRGVGGRELLADTLRERGAAVEYLECYRRVQPDVDPAILTEPLQQGAVDIVIVTSNEGLENLLAMAGDQAAEQLLTLPLIVVSERSRDRARQLGFRGEVIIAQQPSDQGLIDAVLQWKARQ
ncbi:MAG: uroporphyrinogen-III synthase [Gammaproteobacteria bacterium]|jgi:uroporphyrinogen-III synthase